MNRTSRQDMPYLTSDLPGIGGAIKRLDEDFVVEEVPLYPASGEGTHLYVMIEKRGMTTHTAIRHVARVLGQRPQAIGYAGLKDAHGITRQRISVEHVSEDAVKGVETEQLRVCGIERHTNKIKLGHLSGNRFEIRIRDVGRGAPERAGAVIDVLQRRGVPNYFGPQRFGVRGDNAIVGRAVMRGDFAEAMAVMLGRPSGVDSAEARAARELFDRGDYEAAARAWPRALASNGRVCAALARSGGNMKAGWRAVDHSLRRLLVSAVQSALFNAVLAERIDGLDRLVTGDVAWKHANGACFLVEDASVEQPRCDRFEISPSGPLFGKKMKTPEGASAEIERSVLERGGLRAEQVTAGEGGKLEGARRPLRVPVAFEAVTDGRDAQGRFVSLSFTLPPGSYATVVTRELCKDAGPYHRIRPTVA